MLYRIAIARPMEMIIIATRPVPRRRSGPHSPMSIVAPTNPPSTIASGIAASNWMPSETLSHHVNTAPSVIISEMAKFTRPVVA